MSQFAERRKENGERKSVKQRPKEYLLICANECFQCVSFYLPLKRTVALNGGDLLVFDQFTRSSNNNHKWHFELFPRFHPRIQVILFHLIFINIRDVLELNIHYRSIRYGSDGEKFN